ncbi:MAG TPA: uracil-DNA glycosylase [Candidatus Paceibacterota bacterium]|nr:uracil-DNA glycosylase [Candidatus Paceibacterota bacterium]
MNKKIKLQNLHQKWNEECICELKATATQAVYGYGNPDAEIVFIGEAPGKSEDKVGKPFVGRAGKFLDEMLEEIKLKREDIYITNIVKYRPPENRDPLPTEKSACREWLLGELAIVSPKLIVFLGRHAMHNFFPEEEISKSHGRLIVRRFAGIETSHFYPLYHPAAALYNGSMRETLMEDFKRIPKILKTIKNEENK